MENSTFPDKSKNKRRDYSSFISGEREEITSTSTNFLCDEKINYLVRIFLPRAFHSRVRKVFAEMKKTYGHALDFIFEDEDQTETFGQLEYFNNYECLRQFETGSHHFFRAGRVTGRRVGLGIYFN